MFDFFMNYILPISASLYIVGGLSLGGYGMFKFFKSQ